MNKIDNIITLSDNSKYMILDQGNYKGKCYYLTSKLDANNNLTEEFDIICNDNNKVSNVTNQKLLFALVDYFKERMQVVA